MSYSPAALLCSAGGFVTGVLLRKEGIQNRLLVDLPVTAVGGEEKT